MENPEFCCKKAPISKLIFLQIFASTKNVQKVYETKSWVTFLMGEVSHVYIFSRDTRNPLFWNAFHHFLPSQGCFSPINSLGRFHQPRGDNFTFITSMNPGLVLLFTRQVTQFSVSLNPLIRLLG